jgi:two-component system LytT family response regulator
VDDEPDAREVVLTLLAEYPEVEVIGQAGNGREAVELVRRTRPDLLFLDIQMPDKDGFGVLEALGDDVPRGVVFVTAHDQHAIRAFDVHALDYVLKPFGRPRFSAAVSRALERLTALDALSLRRTLDSMAGDRRAGEGAPSELSLAGDDRGDTRQAPIRRIGVRMGSKVVIVPVETVDWIEAFGDYARIHVGRQVHLVSQRMHALERALEAQEFVRVHRSLIVNISRIRELHRESDGSGTIVLRDGVRLRVARGRWDALQSALEMEEL